jgi:DNA-binding CsgD family transcriptional regulator
LGWLARKKDEAANHFGPWRKKMKELTPLEREAHEHRQTGKKIREIAKIMNRQPEQIRMWCAKARRKLGLPFEYF